MSVIIRRSECIGNSCVPLAIFLSSNRSIKIGGFQVEIGTGQTLGDPFDKAVQLNLLSSGHAIRFVVQNNDGFLQLPHSDFNSDVDPSSRWVRLEICPRDQRHMDLDRERFCQI
jgi:hypothetical protein